MVRFRITASRAALLAFAGLIGAGSSLAAPAAPVFALRDAVQLAQGETLVPLEQVFASLRKRYGDETRKNATHAKDVFGRYFRDVLLSKRLYPARDPKGKPKPMPAIDDYNRIVQLLGIRPIDIVRRSEPQYAALGLGDTTPDDDVLRAMAEHPILIERPIVVRNGRAVVGRPPETVQEIL